MANPLALVIGFAVSLATTFVFVPYLIPILKAKGIVGRDLNKPDKPVVAEMGGIPVVVGFFAGMSVIVAFDGVTDINLLNVSLSAILGAAFVGMMDDIFNLRQRQKAFLPFVLALPFATAVDTHVVIPHIAEFDLGYLMIPVAAFALTCAANAANMLEGFNGLGAGLGIIMTSTLVVLCVVHDRLDGLYLLVPLLGGLLAFLWFNWYPAKIFPGDTLMLFTGATIAGAGLLSTLDFQTGFIFIPLIVEFFLKLRGRFGGENYSTRSTNGYLEYHGRIESLTHVIMRHARSDEKSIVYSIWMLEITVCAFVIFIDILL